MNQFAKYSNEEHNHGETNELHMEPSALTELVNNLHNDFMSLAQSVADIKEELASIRNDLPEAQAQPAAPTEIDELRGVIARISDELSELKSVADSPKSTAAPEQGEDVSFVPSTMSLEDEAREVLGMLYPGSDRAASQSDLSIAPTDAPDSHDAHDANKPMTDEEIQALLAEAAGSPAEASEACVAHDAVDAPDSNLPMTDEEIQALLAAAAGTQTTEPPIEPDRTQTSPNDSPDVKSEPLNVTSSSDDSCDARESASLRLPQPTFEVDVAAIKAVPAHLAIAALAIPVKIVDKAITCKVVEPFDLPALELIAQHTGKKIEPEAANVAEVVSALRKYYGPDGHALEHETVADLAANKKRSLFNKRDKEAS